MRFKEGTVSILFGCHSIVHCFVVLISWIILYKKIPKFWQIICILIHDVGHIGLDYLTDIEDKKKHWILGANIAKKLFGQKGYNFTAGHCSYSKLPPSLLYKADKYSWYIAPRLWLYFNCIVEPKLKCGFNIKKAVDLFTKNVRKSITSGEYTSTHEFYLSNLKN